MYGEIISHPLTLGIINSRFFFLNISFFFLTELWEDYTSLLKLGLLNSPHSGKSQEPAGIDHFPTWSFPGPKVLPWQIWGSLSHSIRSFPTNHPFSNPSTPEMSPQAISRHVHPPDPNCFFFSMTPKEVLQHFPPWFLHPTSLCLTWDHHGDLEALKQSSPTPWAQTSARSVCNPVPHLLWNHRLAWKESLGELSRLDTSLNGSVPCPFTNCSTTRRIKKLSK